MSETREDITHYSNDELSLRVSNTKDLYQQRHQPGLYRLLKSLFIFTPIQWDVLLKDLDDDSLSREED